MRQYLKITLWTCFLSILPACKSRTTPDKFLSSSEQSGEDANSVFEDPDLESKIRQAFVKSYTDGDSQNPSTSLSDQPFPSFTVEGDMIIIDQSMNLGAMQKNTALWPLGIIPYQITNNAKKFEGLILDAINHIASRTNIQFLDASDPTYQNLVNQGFIDHSRVLKFLNEGNEFDICAGTLGFQSDPSLVIGDGCDTGKIIHELLHVLGFRHEQIRPDRDQYVKLVPENFETIKNEYGNVISPMTQYEVMSNTRPELQDMPFDFDSILLYCYNEFSKQLSKPTMLRIKYDNPDDEQKWKGKWKCNSDILSQIDIQSIQALYPQKVNLPASPNEYTRTYCFNQSKVVDFSDRKPVKYLGDPLQVVKLYNLNEQLDNAFNKMKNYSVSGQTPGVTEDQLAKTVCSPYGFVDDQANNFYYLNMIQCVKFDDIWNCRYNPDPKEYPNVYYGFDNFGCSLYQLTYRKDSEIAVCKTKQFVGQK